MTPSSFLFRRKLIYTSDVALPLPTPGIEWDKLTDTYTRLRSRRPPLAVAVVWDAVEDTYVRPERG